MSIKDLLEFVRKTNPDITENKLLKELCISKYSTVGLTLSANKNTP